MKWWIKKGRVGGTSGLRAGDRWAEVRRWEREDRAVAGERKDEYEEQAGRQERDEEGERRLKWARKDESQQHVTKSFIKLQNTSPPQPTRRALWRRTWHIHPPRETKESKCSYPQANHTRHGLSHWTQQPKHNCHSHCHSLSSKSRSVQQCRQNHLCFSKTLSLFAV